MGKLSTGCGDWGCTRIFHCNLNKDSPVVDIIGAVDELQSALDMARINCSYSDIIEKIQEEGLTNDTEEIIQDNADDLIDNIDDFDEDVQIEILENL